MKVYLVNRYGWIWFSNFT